ncbi:hypothetical protein [Leptolyngbya sp. CCY15150]|jgi:hypothetical protein|uniref:hypothetical protein n=1 Tax=Leptolyngbya sp. CCY15150 TaxID=2767772 RepID=UPI00194DFC3B|nr:hypothetical protein [Leptolyngbya sp. CCY15150]
MYRDPNDMRRIDGDTALDVNTGHKYRLERKFEFEFPPIPVLIGIGLLILFL